MHAAPAAMQERCRRCHSACDPAFDTTRRRSYPSNMFQPSIACGVCCCCRTPACG